MKSNIDYMGWEFCKFDLLNDLSGQGMNINIFISDNSGADQNPFNILYKVSDINNNIEVGLSLMRNYADVFETELDLNCQDKDDIYFYKGMIENSYDYHNKSFDVKKKKLIFDLNEILNNKIFKTKGNRISKIESIDNKSILSLEEIYKDYEEINRESEKKIKPIWIKDNHFEKLDNLYLEMNRVFRYHYEIYLFFLESILREIQFYNIE